MSTREWTCVLCTFKSPVSSAYCTMCDNPNPNATVVDTHIELASANHGNHKNAQSKNNILAHMKTKSVVWLESIRGENALLDAKHNPTKHLCCLHIINIMVILGCILLVSAVEGNIMNIQISMPNDEGTFLWSFGWLKATFRDLDDATCAVCPYDGLSENEVPISASMVYSENAGDLLIVSLGIILIWIIVIIYILCERSNSHEPLFIKCKCCKIPQRATIFHAFSIINTFILMLIIYYFMLAIYGFIEADFYLTVMISDCSKENDCWLYPYPHYGYCVLIIMFVAIMLFAYSKAEGLDDKLSVKTLNEYYPENQEKATNKNIDFERLLSSFGVLKRIAIISFIMCYSFQEVGMITILFRQETDASYNQYIEFQGLTNRHGVIPNFFVSSLNLNVNSSSNATSVIDIDDFYSNKWDNEASSFSSIASSWDSWLAFITGINIIIALYLVVVVTRFSSNKCMKFIIFGITCIEWLGHIVFMAMYYFQWSNFFSNDAKSVLELELSDLTGEEFSVLWFPDWGALIAVILLFYLTKFMYLEYKAL
eukprot:513767_1